MYKCDDCGEEFLGLLPEYEFCAQPAHEMVKRLDVGGTVPHGVCARCGAFVYELPKKGGKDDAD